MSAVTHFYLSETHVLTAMGNFLRAGQAGDQSIEFFIADIVNKLDMADPLLFDQASKAVYIHRPFERMLIHSELFVDPHH